MDACLQLIDAEGISAVSLRRVARAAGVSPGAPYHHFADRAALLAVLSTRGFELLAEQLTAARSAADTPVGALTALVEAYVAFARHHPAYFRLMFRPELSHPHKHPHPRIAGDAAFQVLTDVVTDGVRAGMVPAERADVVAVALWGLGHGLASLWLDGQLDERSAELDTTSQTLTSQVTHLLQSLLTGSGWPYAGRHG